MKFEKPQLQWRRLRPEELDHEIVWLSVSVGAALLGGGWLLSGIATPQCVWHQLTGFACPSCGATRCVRDLLQGDIVGAFAVNPLFFVLLVGVAAYNAYALWSIFIRRERLRFVHFPPWLGTASRFGIPALILINWAWLIATGV